MPFGDDNTLEDIQGCYLVASGWSDFHPELDIHDQLAEFVERIQDKLARNRNNTRHNWFTLALEHAQQARQHYRNGQIERGRQALRLAWEYSSCRESPSIHRNNRWAGQRRFGRRSNPRRHCSEFMAVSSS